ncbi:MAG: hypothetical protein V4660_12975 [Pseudomonadota bacterium]
MKASTLQIYYNGWYDEFYPNCECAEQLFDHLNAIDTTPKNKDAFINSECWHILRKLSALTLAESGLGVCDLPEK